MKYFKKTQNMLSSPMGSALLIALFSVSFMIIIATELMYETSVEFVMSTKAVDEVKAYYAARAGVEISLLRIQIFKKVKSTIGDALPDKTLLDQIWQFPFAWPPIPPKEASGSTKDDIQKISKKSGMQAKYLVTISSEGSKIDLNDLVSTSKVIAKSTHDQVVQMFQSRVQYDEAFAAEYRGYDFNKLVNNITDWMSSEPQSLNGGDKKNSYQDFKSEFVPPSQPFKTLQELHMVAGMTDSLYEVLAPSVTIFGAKAVNINQATKEILMSLSSQITEDRAKEILKARSNPNRGPFRDMKDFLGFLASLGISGNPFLDAQTQQEIPLSFSSESNFRIKSTGISGKLQKNIETVVYDFDQVKANLKTAVLAEKQAQQTQQGQGAGQTTGQAGSSGAAQVGGVLAGQNPNGATPGQNPANPANGQSQKIPVSNERPSVIYWQEN